MPGTLDNTPFHIFGMKEPDYKMIIMPTYKTLERKEDYRTRRVFKNNNDDHKTQKMYPEVLSNHFCYRHTVDDNNGRRYAPMSL